MHVSRHVIDEKDAKEVCVESFGLAKSAVVVANAESAGPRKYAVPAVEEGNTSAENVIQLISGEICAKTIAGEKIKGPSAELKREENY